jgi:pimeloyl-ACP methyl ester carboxylesterase
LVASGRYGSRFSNHLASAFSFLIIVQSDVQTKSSVIRTPLILLIILVIISTGCIAARRNPNLQQIFATARATSGKRPVIVIPGILGSELINSKTGEHVWPTPFRTSEEGLPMNADLSLNTDDLIPGRIVETVKLARILPEVYVYRDLLEALRRYVGYREGNWENPATGDDKDIFYVFAYDWRKDNVGNARELTRRVARLKEKLGRPDLRFNIVAHSMGGLIARYAAMYGDSDLPSHDQEIRPTWAGAIHINKIVMIGVPNEGSTDAFATLIDGYSITEGLRRRVPLLNKLSAEDAVRTPSVFQLLPHGESVRFLDENLQPVQIDLYDAAVWKRYGWSRIHDADFRRRYSDVREEPRGNGFTSDRLNNLDRYLEATLKHTRRFHRALDARASGDPPVTLLAIGGDCEETLNSPVILRDEKRARWLTLIRPKEFQSSAGVRYSKRQVTEAMYAPGDGRVTRASLLGQVSNSTGVDLPLAYAVFGCDLHGQLQRNKILQDNALSAIVEGVIK